MKRNTSDKRKVTEIANAAAIVFASHDFVIKRPDMILAAFGAMGIDFQRFMAKHEQSDKQKWQLTVLKEVLRGYKNKKRRVFRFDMTTKEWYHLPGLLWIGTRRENPVIKREDVVKRLTGTRSNHVLNQETAQTKIDDLDAIIDQVKSGVVFEQPRLPGMGLFDKIAA